MTDRHDLYDKEWDFGEDQEVGERWIREGFPPEAIGTFTEKSPEEQAEIRNTCKRLKEFYDAQQKFREIERRTGDRDPKTLPRGLCVMWMQRFQAYSAARMRLVAAIKEQRGEVDFFNGLVMPELPVSDGEYR